MNANLIIVSIVVVSWIFVTILGLIGIKEEIDKSNVKGVDGVWDEVEVKEPNIKSKRVAKRKSNAKVAPKNKKKNKK